MKFKKAAKFLKECPTGCIWRKIWPDDPNGYSVALFINEDGEFSICGGNSFDTISAWKPVIIQLTVDDVLADDWTF